MLVEPDCFHHFYILGVFPAVSAYILYVPRVSVSVVGKKEKKVFCFYPFVQLPLCRLGADSLLSVSRCVISPQCIVLVEW